MTMTDFNNEQSLLMDNSIHSRQQAFNLSPVPFLPLGNLNTTSNYESPRLTLPEVTEKPSMD
jgi:hypothetical protein